MGEVARTANKTRASSKPASARGAVHDTPPEIMEWVIRTFLTCATYQGDCQFFRLGAPERFFPRDEALGVTMTVITREHVYEVGLFGTEPNCLELARRLSGFTELNFNACADALGEQMNLVAGRLAQTMAEKAPERTVQLGLPNTYVFEQCLTYRTQVIPLYGQQVGCDYMDEHVWLTVSERTPFFLAGESLAQLRRGSNRMALSGAVALLDEMLELNDSDDDDELALLEHCKQLLVKRINDGPGDLGEPLQILQQLQAAWAPLDKSALCSSPTSGTEKIEVNGIGGALVLEFMAEAREVVDSVDATLMLSERHGTNAKDIAQLFRVFHNLKGSAGMVSIAAVVEIAHETETLLSDVRDSGKPLDELRLAFVQASSTLIRHQIDLIQQAVAHEGQLRRVPGQQEHCSRLRALHKGEAVECIHLDEWLGIEEPKTSRAVGETVRVELDTISRVVGLVRGLALVREQFGTDSEEALENLTRVQDRLLQLSHEMSLVSCKTLVHKISRLVRDLSRTLGKMVSVEFEGADHRLSRAVLNSLSDPLIHIIRNCIDHGIELPEERRLTDKPALAGVSVKFLVAKQLLRVEVSDDGRGIDADRVRRVARQRGLIGSDSQLDWQRTCELLLMPGFSTAREISDVSGRGVGLDVVKKTLEDLGGELELTSEKGRGTTIALKIPMDRFEEKERAFSDSLEVLLMDEAEQENADIVAGEVGWFA